MGAGQGGEGDVAGGGNFGGGVGETGAAVQQREGGFFAQVVDNHGVAGALNVGGHAAAHVAQSDETNSFHDVQMLPIRW